MSVARYLVLICAAASLNCRNASESDASGPLLGLWGGPHLELRATDVGVSFEYDCGAAAIAGPVVFDRTGRAERDGVHFAGQPVVSVVPPAESRPDHFIFQRTGDQLRVTVRVGADGPSATFQLTRGSGGALIRCL